MAAPDVQTPDAHTHGRWAVIAFVVSMLFGAPLVLAHATVSPLEDDAVRAGEARVQEKVSELSPQADRAARIEWITAQLEAVRKARGIPGIAACVVSGGEPLLVRGFGVRDLERNLPMTPLTLAPLGEVTHGFNSLLLAWQLDRGLTHWDDRVHRLLPGFRLHETGASGRTTLGDLLASRTGLMSQPLAWRAGTATREEMLHAMAQAEPTFPRGTRWQPNELGWLVAGLVTEARGEAPWEVLLTRAYLEPLAMRSTVVAGAGAPPEGEVARGYRRDHSGALEPAPAIRIDQVTPALGLWSNVTDLAAWVGLLAERGRVGDERLVASERLDELWRPLTTLGPGYGPETGAASVGMGWFNAGWRGERMVFQEGSIDGFRVMVALLPEKRIGCAVICNASDARIGEWAPDILFGGAMGEIEGAHPLAIERDERRLAGRYVDETQPGFAEVTVDGARVMVRLPGQVAIELLPPDEAGVRYAMGGLPIEVTFQHGPDGSPRALRMRQGGVTAIFPREGVQREPDVDSIAVGPLVGRYRDEEQGRDIEVRVVNGRLVFDVLGQGAFVLDAADEAGWYPFRSIDVFAVRFEHDDNGEVSGLTLRQRSHERRLPRVGEVEADDGTSFAALMERHRAAHAADTLDGPAKLRLEGTVNYVNQGVSGRFELAIDERGEWSQSIDLGPFGFLRLRADDEGVRCESAFGPIVSLVGRPAAELMLTIPFVPASAERASTAAHPAPLLRQVGPEQAVRHAVVHTADEGARSVTWIDQATALAVRLDGMTWTPIAGLEPIVMTMADYRVVGGMHVPFHVETNQPSLGHAVFVVEHATVEHADAGAPVGAIP